MDSLETVAQRYFAAWANRDPDEIVSLHADDTSFCTHLGTPAVTGRAAVRAAFADIFERFPDFSFHVYRVLYGPRHWVLDWALLSGDVRFDCLDVVEVGDDGRVERKDTFIDSAQMYAALAGRS